MLGSYSTVSGKNMGFFTPKEEAMYATDYWKFICNFHNCKNVLYKTRMEAFGYLTTAS
jgi:hypothetical protein